MEKESEQDKKLIDDSLYDNVNRSNQKSFFPTAVQRKTFDKEETDCNLKKEGQDRYACHRKLKICSAGTDGDAVSMHQFEPFMEQSCNAGQYDSAKQNIGKKTEKGNMTCIHVDFPVKLKLYPLEY